VKKIFLKEVLKRELKARGESIQSISVACRIPHSTVHEWTQGRLPSARNLHHLSTLADHLGISLNALLFNVTDDAKNGSSILFSTTFVDEERRYRLIIEKVPK
jgi:transcriptional regulator with XRE-family HTH domain